MTYVPGGMVEEMRASTKSCSRVGRLGAVYSISGIKPRGHHSLDSGVLNLIAYSIIVCNSELDSLEVQEPVPWLSGSLSISLQRLI